MVLIGWFVFSVFTSHVIKTKNRNRSMNKVKNLGQVFAVFHLCIICRSVSPKFIELCMETPSLCPSEGHKYGSRKVTETVTVLLLKREKNYCSRDPIH